jgi:aspartate racemase
MTHTNNLKNQKAIGIIGGMGPEATMQLFNWIIKHTPANSDQEHLRVIIDNNPQIPDRVKAILNNGPSPLPELKKMAINLQKSGADLLLMPCNTASYYIDQITPHIKIPLLNMVQETATHIVEHYPKLNTIGLLATQATLRTGIYQTALINAKLEHFNQSISDLSNQIITLNQQRYAHGINLSPDLSSVKPIYNINHLPPGFNVICLPLSIQKTKVSRAINGPNSIKSGNYYRPRQLLIQAANQLHKFGAQAIIMGCTEIPLALKQTNVKVKLIDPSQIIAKKAVKIALNMDQ